MHLVGFIIRKLCVTVRSRNLVDEEAPGPLGGGLSRHKKDKYQQNKTLEDQNF